MYRIILFLYLLSFNSQTAQGSAITSHCVRQNLGSDISPSQDLD